MSETLHRLLQAFLETPHEQQMYKDVLSLVVPKKMNQMISPT